MNWPLFIGLFAAAVAVLALVEAAAEWYGKWSAKHYVDKRMADVLAGRLPAPTEPKEWRHEIVFDATGFSILPRKREPKEPLKMLWSDVDEVVAFKRDLWSYDLICLSVVRADGMGWELNEEMKSWNAFVETLPEHLRGCRKFHEWHWEISVPAFVPNPTVLFHRGAFQTAPLRVAA